MKTCYCVILFLISLNLSNANKNWLELIKKPRHTARRLPDDDHGHDDHGHDDHGNDDHGHDDHAQKEMHDTMNKNMDNMRDTMEKNNGNPNEKDMHDTMNKNMDNMRDTMERNMNGHHDDKDMHDNTQKMQDTMNRNMQNMHDTMAKNNGNPNDKDMQDTMEQNMQNMRDTMNQNMQNMRDNHDRDDPRDDRYHDDDDDDDRDRYDDKDYYDKYGTVCHDLDDWRDSNGNPCKSYDGCTGVERFAVNGVSAMEACCRCGGGRIEYRSKASTVNKKANSSVGVPVLAGVIIAFFIAFLIYEASKFHKKRKSLAGTKATNEYLLQDTDGTANMIAA